MNQRSCSGRVSVRDVMPMLAAVFVLAGSAPLAGQADVDRGEVMGVIDRLFEGMRTNDGDLVRSVFVEGAMLISTEGGDGSPSTSYTPSEAFASAVGNATEEWDEPYWDPIVQIHDHLATVWIKYALYVAGEFSHCGVDALILTRTADGWKIASLADTRERENCELPPGREPLRSSG